jgi:hypothetical protein
VLSTVGEIEQIAIVKMPAGSGFWTITSPGSNQASGETGRKI